MTQAEIFLARVREVRRQLDEQSRKFAPGLTEADAKTGERWEAGQVWAHLAEILPYWMTEIDRIRAQPGSKPLFGRTKTDAGRLAAIESHRHQAVAALGLALDADITALEAWLSDMRDQEWNYAGTHPTLGEMTVARATEEFLVGHLEEHLQQLLQLENGAR